MVSETFVARELFSCLWNLPILGALRHCGIVLFPFDKQLTTYVEKHNECWRRLLQNIQSFCGFTRDVMEIASDCSPWSGLSSNSTEYASDRLHGDLLLACNESKWSEVDFEDSFVVSRWTKKAFEVQIIAMFDSLLQGRYCFGNQSGISPVEVACIVEDGFRLAQSPVEVRFPRTPLQTTFLWWKEHQYLNDVAEGILESAHQQWLSSAITVFESHLEQGDHPQDTRND
ncbi:MAG: hypothetical protein N2C14_06410 [Planctomycetales bacterium]